VVWGEIGNDANVVVCGWWLWSMTREALRLRRERLELGAMERERWARLAPAPSADADLGTRLARAYLRGVTIFEREECEAVTRYVVADVSGRWPPAPDDLRHIAAAIGEPGSLDYLRSTVPGGGEEGTGEVPAITDDTAAAVTLRLLFTFCPPERDRGDYLTSATFFTEKAGDLPGAILPTLLLRRGTNDRAALEAAP